MHAIGHTQTTTANKPTKIELAAVYDLAVIPAAPVLIRPYVGVGYEEVSVSVCGLGQCVSGGGGSGMITPGVLGAYFFTPNIYAGLDLRLDIATASYGSAVFDIFATGGYKF